VALTGSEISEEALNENAWEKVMAIVRDGDAAWSDTGFFITQQVPALTAATTSKPPPAQTPTMTVS
jgi:hypothetical protein